MSRLVAEHGLRHLAKVRLCNMRAVEPGFLKERLTHLGTKFRCQDRVPAFLMKKPDCVDDQLPDVHASYWLDRVAAAFPDRGRDKADLSFHPVGHALQHSKHRLRKARARHLLQRLSLVKDLPAWPDEPQRGQNSVGLSFGFRVITAV